MAERSQAGQAGCHTWLESWWIPRPSCQECFPSLCSHSLDIGYVGKEHFTAAPHWLSTIMWDSSSWNERERALLLYLWLYWVHNAHCSVLSIACSVLLLHLLFCYWETPSLSSLSSRISLLTLSLLLLLADKAAGSSTGVKLSAAVASIAAQEENSLTSIDWDKILTG